jgi:hypothetical protein
MKRTLKMQRLLIALTVVNLGFLVFLLLSQIGPAMPARTRESTATDKGASPMKPIASASGPIALQWGGRGTIKFRKVEIRPL